MPADFSRSLKSGYLTFIRKNVKIGGTVKIQKMIKKTIKGEVKNLATEVALQEQLIVELQRIKKQQQTRNSVLKNKNA